MPTLAWITAVAFLLIAACAGPPQEVVQSSERPSTTASAEAPPTAAATEPALTAEPPPSVEPPEASSDAPDAQRTQAAQQVQLWFLRDRTPRGQYLEPELHQLAGQTQAVARAAMELLVATKPGDPKLVNLMPQGTRVLDVSLSGATLTVDLDFPNDDVGLGAMYESFLFSQIVHTGAQFSTVKRVRILEEGRTPPSGHFVDLDGPHRATDETVSPVVILEPSHGETVAGGRVSVHGTANVYEATVLLRLIDPNGTTVKETFTSATCGTGCRGTWEHSFSNVTTPGTWTVVAAASDPSDGEGPPPYTTKRTFVVQ